MSTLKNLYNIGYESDNASIDYASLYTYNPHLNMEKPTKKEIVDSTRELEGEIDECITKWCSGCLHNDEKMREIAQKDAMSMMPGIQQQLDFLASYIEKMEE